MTRIFVAIAAAAIAVQQGTEAQRAGRIAGAPDDSVRIERRIRSEQMSFEAFHRRRLPISQSGSHPCDVRVGRYCYWRLDESAEDSVPEEARAIRERRDALLRELDSAAHLLAGDGWIAGQYVRYLMEAARNDDALSFARRDCRAREAWCLALAGYAAHTGQRFALADTLYTAALADMDSTERCRWLDFSNALDDELAHRFDALDCARRAAFLRRVLWLGSPLYSVSESDLWTEFLARRTRAEIVAHSANVDGVTWGDDVRDLLIRYGWSRWYTRSEPPMGSMLEPSVTGHDAGMPYDFLPSAHLLDHLGHATDDDWHLDDRRAPTGYVPAYARSMHDLTGQIATFRRGDSALVVAAWDARRDTTLLGRDLDASLVVVGDTAVAAMVSRATSRATGVLWSAARADSGLASLEVRASKTRRAARTRIGVRAPDAGRVTVSDLLLYSSSVPAPLSLEEVRDSALAGEVVPPSRTVGVFWEAYGLRPRGEPVHFSLSVEQIDVGLMRRAVERLHLADPTTGLRIQWDEVPQPRDGIAGRGVRLDLSRLRGGRYHIRLAVAASGETPAVTTRDVELR